MMHNDISFVRPRGSIRLPALPSPRHHFGTCRGRRSRPSRLSNPSAISALKIISVKWAILIRPSICSSRFASREGFGVAWFFFGSAFGSVIVRRGRRGDSGFTGWCLLLRPIILIKLWRSGDNGETGTGDGGEAGEAGLGQHRVRSGRGTAEVFMEKRGNTVDNSYCEKTVKIIFVYEVNSLQLNQWVL